MTKRPFFPTVAALALCASLAQATTILTFDDIPGGAGGGTLTNQYQDENFLVSQGPLYYGPPGPPYTPLSPPNMGVLYANPLFASIFVLTPASGTWSDFGFYVTTGWLGPTASDVFIQAYDAANNPLGFTQISANVDYTNQFFEVDDQPLIFGDAESPQGASQDDPAITGIAYVDISVFRRPLPVLIDNITFDDFSPAPEPVTWAIMLVALGGLGAQRIHRRRSRGDTR